MSLSSSLGHSAKRGHETKQPDDLVTAERHRLNELFMQAPAFIAFLHGPEMIFEFANRKYMQLIGPERQIIGKSLLEALPEISTQPFYEILKEVYRSKKAYSSQETRVLIDFKENGNLEEVFVNFVYQPALDEQGEIYGILVHGVDVTEQVHTRARIEDNEAKYRSLFDTMDQGFCILEMIFDQDNQPIDYRFLEANAMFEKQTGLKDAIGKTAKELLPTLEDRWFKIYGKVALTGEAIRFVEGSDVMKRWFEVYAFRHGGEHSRKVALLFTDITQRKLAEEALKESENRFRTLSDQSPMIVFIVEPDPEATISYFNRAWLKFTGQNYEEALGRGWYDIVHPEDVTKILEVYQPAFEQRESYYIPGVRLKRVDGEYRWHVFQGNPRYLANGDFGGYVGVGIDIHEQKVAEEALKKSEQRFSSIFNQSSVGIAQIDLTGKFVLVNDRYCEIVGRTKEELYTMKMSDITHPADLQDNLILLKNLIQNGVPFIIEKRYLRPDNTRVWVNNHVNLIRDSAGDSGYITAISQDITKQKEAEKALRESESKFRRFYESNMLPITFWNNDGYVYESNQAFAQLVGYTLAEINEGKFRWQERTPPEYQFLNEELMRRAIQGGESIDPFETELIRKDGKKITVVVGYALLEGAENKGVAFLLDITEQKALMQQLEKRVEERTKELKQSNEDLQQFAHVASHDLKEPVRKIKIFVNKIRDDAAGLDHQTLIYLDKVLRSADRMSTMIEGVLTYSTINAAEQRIEPVDLNFVIDDILVDLEVLVSQKNAQIKTNHLPKVEGARVLIYQLFYNLVNNALKFSKTDVTPVISVTAEESSETETVKILVSDNGIGFDTAQERMIFDTFTRLNSKEKFDGTGLGLALCKKIVERHNGTIDAKGLKDVGATFTIVLPLKQNRMRI